MDGSREAWVATIYQDGKKVAEAEITEWAFEKVETLCKLSEVQGREVRFKCIRSCALGA